MPKNSTKPKKRKTLRESKKYPNLDKTVNTKRTRDYLDNIQYINGAYNKKGEKVIRGLSDEEKAWLNKFNGEYYNANFDQDDSKNLHQLQALPEEIAAQRDYIRDLKDDLKKTKEYDDYKNLKEHIEQEVENLSNMYPRKKCTDARNSRNRDLLNFGKATNKVKFIPWDTSNQNTIGRYDFDPTDFDDDDEDLD